MKPLNLGKTADGNFSIDLPKLIETRAFIQANSGAAVCRCLYQRIGFGYEGAFGDALTALKITAPHFPKDGA
jgi:hypothetical protein